MRGPRVEGGARACGQPCPDVASPRFAVLNPRFQLERDVTGFSARVGAERLYDAYASGDVAAVADLIHDDIDWVVYNPVRIFAFSGPRRGKAQVLEVLGQ